MSCVPNLIFLTSIFFDLITSHHGRILGTKSIKTHKIQASILHPPPRQRHKKTKHTVDKERHSLEQQASRVLQGIDNQVDSPLLHLETIQIQTTKWPTNPGREAEKRAQAAISGGSVAQPARRGGQG